MSAERGQARALLEALRAPLLLTPVSDVLAGWALAMQASAESPAPMPDLALAVLAGCCLLAAGMAENALVDLPQDRITKAHRPLPRGAVPETTVRAAYHVCTLGGLGLAALASAPLLGAALAIVVLTRAYHIDLKRRRLPGSLALGMARGLAMCLGVLAAGSVPTPHVLALVGVYGLYVTGAALHASTDDEAPGSRWAAAGLGICLGALALLGLRNAPWEADRLGALGSLVLAAAAVRLAVAWRRDPPPAITGTALSGLPLVCAAFGFSAGQPAVGLASLAVFLVVTRLHRVFEPT